MRIATAAHALDDAHQSEFRRGRHEVDHATLPSLVSKSVSRISVSGR